MDQVGWISAGLLVSRSRALRVELRAAEAFRAEVEAKRDREAAMIAAIVRDQKIAETRQGRDL